MTLFMRLQWVLLPALLLPDNIVADSEVSIVYSVANPDYKPFESTDGYAIDGRFYFDNGVFLSGYFNETDFKASGPYVGNVDVESWAELGVGFSFDHDSGKFYSLITVENIDTAQKVYDGYGVHIGYSNNFSRNWMVVAQAGYLDTDFDDWQLMGRLYYALSDVFGLTLGIRDYDSWDYTHYEAGVALRF